MTLTKYHLAPDGSMEPNNAIGQYYLASDVDQAVKELQERIKGLEKRIASQRSSIAGKEELHKETKDKLKADLARATAELVDVKWKLKKYEPDMQFHVEGK